MIERSPTSEDKITMIGGLQKHQTPRNDGICPCINSAADIIFEKTHTFIASTLTYDFHISFLAFIYLNQYIVFLNTRQSVGTHIRANFQTLYYLTPPAYLPRIAAGIIYRLLIMLHNSCHLLISKALIVTGQQSQGRLTVSFKLGAFLTQLHTGK